MGELSLFGCVVEGGAVVVGFVCSVEADLEGLGFLDTSDVLVFILALASFCF